MDNDDRKFKFPTDLTRRERLTFSKYADMTIQQLGHLMTDEPEAISVEAEAALILIGARREDPAITFDQVLDHDGWGLELDTSDEEVAETPLVPSPPSTEKTI